MSLHVEAANIISKTQKKFSELEAYGMSYEKMIRKIDKEGVDWVFIDCLEELEKLTGCYDGSAIQQQINRLQVCYFSKQLGSPD